MMFVLVYWIDEKLFSVVEADDVVLDKFNGVLKVGITCPVKWRERSSRKKVEERLYDAQIKAISENDEELEIMCQKLGEEAAATALKQARKRKRTEKGKTWDESIEKEMTPPKQFAVEQTSLATEQNVDTEVSTPTGIITAEKPKKTAPKRKKVDKPSIKKKSSAKETKEGDKCEETTIRKKGPTEKDLQKTAEIESRKSLAADFFKVAAETVKKNDPNIEDVTPINNQNAQDNRQVTPERMVKDLGTKLSRTIEEPGQNRQPSIRTPTPERNNCDVTVAAPQNRNVQLGNRATPAANDAVYYQTPQKQNLGIRHLPPSKTQLHNVSAKNSYVTPPLCSNGNLANIQTYNGQTVEEQNYSVKEQVTTPRPNNTDGAMLTALRQQKYQSPENSPINDTMTIQFAPQREFTNTFTHSPNAFEDQSCQLTAVNNPRSEDFGGIFRSSLQLTIANGDDDIFIDDFNGSPIAASSTAPKCANCESLKQEIEFLKRNQMPDMPPAARNYLQTLLAGGAGNSCNQQSVAAVDTTNYSKHFHPGPGRQELYDGSGVFISKVEINNIHTEAGKRPTEILNKLLGHFFDLQTLASQRESLDDTIVHACTAYAKRCAAVWKNTDRIDYARTIRNKRGSAKRRLQKQLIEKKENLC